MKTKFTTVLTLSFILLSGFVWAQELPTASFKMTGTCAGVAVSFQNLSNTTNVYWDFGDGNDTRKENPLHIFDKPGSYNIKLEAYLNGRTSLIEQTLIISPSPVITLNYSRAAVSDTIRMYVGQNVTTSIAETYPEYEWYLKQSDQWIKQTDKDASFTTSRAGVFKTWVQNDLGCTSEASFVILTSERPEDIIYTTIIVLNNVVTPNDDSFNDVLMVKYLENPEVYTKPLFLSVFNRSGVEVFSTKNYSNDWNATDKVGNPLAAGTYYYIATSEGRRGKTGYIDIIRSE
ncbi:MAG: putative adhesin [Bacteroidota bacterium]|jgi:gliding motility-associated-like protein